MHYVINTIQRGKHIVSKEKCFLATVVNSCLLTEQDVSVSVLKKRFRTLDSQSDRHIETSNSQADEEDRQAMAPPEM